MNRANAALRRALCGPCGFTLVEVAASVAILGGVILGILLARNRALEADAEADQILACTRLCAAQVAALRAGLAGPGEGEFVTPSGKYRWRIRTSALPEDATSAGLTAYQVTVRPATPPRDTATGDSTSSDSTSSDSTAPDSTSSPADEQPDDPCGVSATLWLPVKAVPAKEKEKP